MNISERIFEILKEKKITQKEFSDRTGISQSTISDWKRKKMNPSSDKIMLICDVLDITPYELLSGIENESYRPLDYVVLDKTSKDYELLEAFRTLDSDKKNRLLGYLQALKDM